MRESKKRRIFPLLCLLALLALPACNSAGDPDLPPEPDEGVLVYAALNPLSDVVQGAVKRFNAAHEDVQIEVRDYSDENGPQRLLTELMLGQVPDVMEMYRLGEGNSDRAWNYNPINRAGRPEGEYLMPYRQLTQKGYLEDLWPYIENDPELGREGVLEAPLRAAEINGGLYMIFPEVSVTTLIGPQHIVGDRSGWTLEELMETFSSMPEDSTILRYDATRSDMFFGLFLPSLEQYVDWETGQCSFDSEGFREILTFLEAFPSEFETTLSQETVDAEIAERMVGGKQMLEVRSVELLRDISSMDLTFLAPASIVGFPTTDGGLGSYFNPHGARLAMSSACGNKEAAWDFIRQIIAKKYDYKMVMEMCRMRQIHIPVVRKTFELTCENDMREVPFWLGRDGPNHAYYHDGPTYDIETPDEDDLQRYEALINNTTRLYWPDDALSELIWEAIGPYFAGDRTLDDTIGLLGNRVGLYLNEQK